MTSALPRQSVDVWPSFYTWCSFCGVGQQEATRSRVDGTEAVYESSCIDCGDGFPVRVPAGTPASEARAFLEYMSDRWRQFEEPAG